MQLSHSPKRGFSLVELTIILIILFAVGLVIYPVYAGRPRKNMGLIEMSNQKQIGLGFMMYVQDYDERFPPAVTYVGRKQDPKARPIPSLQFAQSWGPQRELPDGRTVPGLVSPYVKDKQSFLNPRNSSRGKDHILELMYNDLIASQDFKVVASPSLTVLLTSAENRLENAGHALTPDSGPFPAVFNVKGSCDAGQGATIRDARVRNNGGTYFAFSDGHVKWFKGGVDDRIFFPPRSSSSKSSTDAQTKKQLGPRPNGKMQFNGRTYAGTFHLN